MSEIIYICGNCGTEWNMEDPREGLDLSVIPCLTHWVTYEENGTETCPVCNKDLRSEYSDVMSIPHKTKDEREREKDKLSQAVELLGEMKKKCYFETDSGEWICRHCGVNRDKDHSLYCETKSIDAFLKEVKGE